MTAVLFLGAKEIGARCLRLLLESDAEVLAVVPGRPRISELHPVEGGVDEIAQAAGIPTVELSAAPPADLLVSVQYHAVLSPEELRLAGRCVNLHMAPLPEYRGANQFSHAILNGDTEFGTTLHLMTERVDAGPILAERRFPIEPSWTAYELFLHTIEQSAALFERALRPLLANELLATPQEEVRPDAPRRFYSKESLDGLKRVDFSWEPGEILRHVRALDMPGYEPAFAEVGGLRIYLSTRH